MLASNWTGKPPPLTPTLEGQSVGAVRTDINLPHRSSKVLTPALTLAFAYHIIALDVLTGHFTNIDTRAPACILHPIQDEAELAVAAVR